MPTRHASAVWEGGLQTGKGSFRAGTGAFSGNYSFGSRFQEAPGTNPEELIAAAHAGCLSMALSAGLERAGTPAQRIETKAACTIEKVGDAFRITKMQLTVRGKVPGLTQAQFAAAAETAKNGCPVSNALKNNVEFVLDAKLE